ncbi:MAG TPA: histidine kinase [Thermoanaerobaculia bacterium]
MSVAPARKLSPPDRRLILRVALGLALVSTLLMAGMHWVRGHVPLVQELGVGEEPRPFWYLALLEVPVWFGWVLLLPALLRLADAFPLLGARRWPHLAVHLLAFPAAVLASAALITLGRWPWLGIEPGGFLAHVAVYSVIMVALSPPLYAVILLSHHALCYARHLRRRELDEARLAGLLTQARLQALQSQIQPHFLFNALNGVSGLIGRDDARARRLLAELGALLRAVIDADEDQEVPLADELAMLDRYVALQRARYGERLRLSRRVPPEALELLVPRFVLQPLVENSVKHAVERRLAPVEVVVAARVEGGRLVLSVADDGPGPAAGAPEGVGLGNLRERLRVLYGDSSSLGVAARPEGGTEATVVLPASGSVPRAELEAVSA